MKIKGHIKVSMVYFLIYYYTYFEFLKVMLLSMACDHQLNEVINLLFTEYCDNQRLIIAEL